MRGFAEKDLPELLQVDWQAGLPVLQGIPFAAGCSFAKACDEHDGRGASRTSFPGDSSEDIGTVLRPSKPGDCMGPAAVPGSTVVDLQIGSTSSTVAPRLRNVLPSRGPPGSAHVAQAAQPALAPGSAFSGDAMHHGSTRAYSARRHEGAAMAAEAAENMRCRGPGLRQLFDDWDAEMEDTADGKEVEDSEGAGPGRGRVGTPEGKDSHLGTSLDFFVQDDSTHQAAGEHVERVLGGVQAQLAGGGACGQAPQSEVRARHVIVNGQHGDSRVSEDTRGNGIARHAEGDVGHSGAVRESPGEKGGDRVSIQARGDAGGNCEVLDERGHAGGSAAASDAAKENGCGTEPASAGRDAENKDTGKKGGGEGTAGQATLLKPSKSALRRQAKRAAQERRAARAAADVATPKRSWDDWMAPAAGAPRPPQGVRLVT